ncbi:MBL fold metallo-hydrolase [Ornithinicoccus halotolerans]|uniref:MBL fold metallo-hydrolase n=1 Tax=Ornithinicoccus halotolerans TaxID=1748220 RepID=UPI001E467F38|nr:MBL fold metallo-hydrolase [Ornithinicoccus halotolerans]
MPRTLTVSPGPGPSPQHAGSLYFIGNASVLIRYAGFTVLTDPTFVHRHEKVPLGYGLSTTRLTDPAMEVADLPPLDLVLLSHFHGDHFDQVAERELDNQLPVVTTPQSAAVLGKRGFTNSWPLRTWESLEVVKGQSRLRISACPGRHGPGVTDLVLPDVMGSVLEFLPDGNEVTQRIYISGDTLVYDDLHQIPRRYPDLDVGLLHLGGTRVLKLLVTMDAKQGVEAMRIIGPRTVLPVHYDDYDVFTSGLQEFLDAARSQGLADRVHAWSRGDSYALG